ncbi:rRNA maturation RNase YbeY [bacterium]|nr:rRNA maturation RNase YbeY [bacterium]MBU1598876.1 rRNA maturation RNase YbeY [bacterium]MBU2462418.1 rRNA maturation RNase YbeY [bacterium]
MQNVIKVTNKQKKRLPIRRLKALAENILAQEAQKGELSIVLGNDELLCELNKAFLKKDEPTDVLAFPLGDGIIGEVIVSVDMAERYAKEDGKSLAEEVGILASHGILHILGYKHSESMRKKEVEYAQIMC